jgi:L-seryl-tRNA(Ser) seleniumtransferase
MSDNPFERWQLTRVLNASGTMTSIGASRVPKAVREAVDRILGEFVMMDELQARAGTVIARLTGAEDGCITACSAAAMTQAVAACLTGLDLARIEALPQVTGERRVLLPMGHMVNYGAPVEQAIRLAGAEVVPVGTAAACESWHLRAALESGAAAAMYVVSHHTVRKNELPMDVFIGLCREYGVPVIVDMASEYDLRGPVALGASAVIYSGHKFLSGVTSGIVAGTRDLIRSTYLQHRGIGRTMKAGKESVVGAMAALKLWETRNHDAVRIAEEARVTRWLSKLSTVPGLSLAPHADWTGNPITRARITVDPDNAGFNAWELAERLSARSPRIIVRDDLIERQEIYLDPCNITDEEAGVVAAAIGEEAERFRSQGDGCRISWSDAKCAHEAAALSWKGDDAAA